MLEHLISEDELAERIGKTKACLVAWRHYGRGPPWIKLGGKIYFDKRKVDEWIAANEHVPQRAAS
jgi:predicted DNA-binding transcriptional regulator AlpA